MDQRIKQLLNRLAFFGYCTFEVKKIIEDAIGTDSVTDLNFVQGTAVISHLEKYEQLGLNYLQTYSK